jgi:D-inositol-3-phosphate glycosyltransferase
VKIAMVSEHASPLAVLGGVDAGGQNVHVANLASTMAQEGADITVHTRRDDEALPAQVEFRGITVDHVVAGPPEPVPKDELLPFMGRFAESLHAAWREDPPVVVHAHFWMSGHAALAAARPLGIPVVQTFHALGVVKRRHQGDKDTSHPGRIEAERAIMRGADWIVATCSDEVGELEREGASLGRVSVVPCGVDLDEFRPAGEGERRDPSLGRLVMVGRLVERKGIDNAIAALRALPGVELVVAGGPTRDQLATDPEANRLLALAEELGVADRVLMRGRVEREHVPALIRSADAVLCVPWYEPFGIVPLEAMACGVPVIASAIGGMLDTVVDGVTGLHVTPRDASAIVRAAHDLLPHHDRRKRMGVAGIRRARELYSWERVAADTLEVYREVVQRSVSRQTGGEVLA